MNVGVFHPGTQHSWQSALAFQEIGALRWYATSVFYDPARWPYRVERWLPAGLSGRLSAQWRRRYTPRLRPDLVRQFGAWEWFETGARRLRLGRASEAFNRAGNRAFGRRIVGLLELEPVDLVWGFNTSALEVFQWAKPRGIRCVLDQTTGHPAAQNAIMRAEQEAHPEFFEHAYRPHTAEALERQEAELALADAVVVGSEYCAQTLLRAGCPSDKLHVVPYGYDESLFPNAPPRRQALGGRTVELLCVGEVSPGKGVARLLKALELLDSTRVRLTLVGRRAVPQRVFDRYRHRFTHVPPVSRASVVEFFRRADCLVFPSLFEGGGIVLYEARGSGLGIVQSDRCGDGVCDGANGLVLADLAVASLAAALAGVVADPARLESWQAASWRLRGERTWAAYRLRARALAGEFVAAAQPFDIGALPQHGPHPACSNLG